MMSGEQEALADLAQGWRGERPHATDRLQGDASSRRFYRLRFAEGTTAIGMATPTPPAGDGGHDFVAVAAHLARAGVAVPEVFTIDLDMGLMLVEDLGDELLERASAHSPSGGLALYRQAIDELTRIHGAHRVADVESPATRRQFDETTFRRELDLFRDHALVGFFGIRTDGAIDPLLDEAFEWVVSRLLAMPFVVTHRDYHCRNLLVHDSRLRVIDFQDARRGPFTYDLASLLADPYAELPEPWTEELVERFEGAIEEIEPTCRHRDLAEDLGIAMVQRCLKAAGTYAIQILERGNGRYRPALPVALHRAAAAMERFEELAPLRELVIGLEGGAACGR